VKSHDRVPNTEQAVPPSEQLLRPSISIICNTSKPIRTKSCSSLHGAFATDQGAVGLGQVLLLLSSRATSTVPAAAQVGFEQH
jgi:hypothetical protein